MNDSQFARKSAIAAGVAIGLILLVLFLYYSLYVLLLAFAGALIAVLLRGAAEWVTRRTKMPVGAALGVVILTSLFAAVMVVVLVGSTINKRANEFATKLPESAARVEKQLLERYPWMRSSFGLGGDSTDASGRDAKNADGVRSDGMPRELQSSPRSADRLDSLAPNAEISESTAPSGEPTSQPTTSPSTQPSLMSRAAEAVGMGDVAGAATRAIQRLIGGVVALVVVFVVAIYLAAQPEWYIAGLLHLLPHAARPRMREILYETGFVLRAWMIAQLVPMAVIGVFTAVGLKLIGVEMWLTLGLLAAIFNFIPNFGPLISFIPAVLFALAGDDGPARAGWVTLLYIVAQSLEGYVLTPLVQRRAIELPPAVLILAQVLLGILAGGLGLILAAPLTAAAFVIVKMAWVREALSDPVPLPSEEAKE